MRPVFTALPDVIAAHARHRPLRIALEQGDVQWTWNELGARVDAVAARLKQLGVRRGHRVAILSTNRMEAYAIALGTLRAGGVSAPLSPLLTPAQLASVLKDSGARLLWIDPALRPLADACLAVPGAPKVRAVDLSALPEPSARPDARAPLLKEGDLATLIYSSGTTGQPKGILHDHLARLLQAAGLAAEFSIGDRARTLLATPLHTNGTWMMALPTLASGGAIVLLERFEAGGALDLMRTSGVTHAFVVPTMLRAMQGVFAVSPGAFPDLVMCVSAGSALPTDLKRSAFDMFGGRLGELYGLTEGVATVLKPQDLLTHIETVGRPGGGVEMVILDPAGREVATGEDGEIAGRSSGLMRGYHGAPAAMRDLLWKDRRGRPFFRTGDMGRMDQNGYLTITDRKKDMIVSGGLNVFSADIEAALREHPDVADAAVIAAPDPKWGEVPLAVVIPASAAASPDEIAAFANARLAKHQRVAKVVLRTEDFPRNILGKVLKRELREQYNA